MMKPRFEIFPSHQGYNPGYYWRLRAGNGRIVAIGAEPFSSIQSVKRGLTTAHNLGECALVRVVKR